MRPLLFWVHQEATVPQGFTPLLLRGLLTQFRGDCGFGSVFSKNQENVCFIFLEGGLILFGGVVGRHDMLWAFSYYRFFLVSVV